MTDFAIRLERLPSGAVTVAPRGELDLEHAYAFDHELRRVEGERPPCIVIDLRELRFAASCGIARLIAARRRARRAGRRLVLVRGGPAIQRLLALTGVDETFEIVGQIPIELCEERPGSDALNAATAGQP
jgi:anti-sigma B factor antagonist